MRDIEPSLEAIARLRRDGAFVHCLTNSVAQYLTANVLLACNAKPTMTSSRDEALRITAGADALLINLGTLEPSRRRVMDGSVMVAAERGIPIVLDPVKCELSPVRLAFAHKLLRSADIIVKANETEANVLKDAAPYCRITTGAVDRVEFGARTFTVHNGTPMQTQTIATGCALGALVAALAAVEENAGVAAVAALVWFGVAAELAEKKADGPGTFPALLVDALASVEARQLARKAMVR